MIDEKLKLYMQGILKANEYVNLTAITEPEEFEVKHIIDSLACVEFNEFRKAERIIDVGTGAGFPGIPLAVHSPEKKFVLMDSLKKRLSVIDELAEKLEIRNVITIHARAEELSREKNHREMYDLSVSRAVANLATLSEYCLPFIKTGGYLLAYKGPEAEEEVSGSKKAIELLGGRFREIRTVEMEKYGINHKIVVIEKVKSTPPEYPRKAGMPARKPIR